jgi:thioredoxin-related protein
VFSAGIDHVLSFLAGTCAVAFGAMPAIWSVAQVKQENKLAHYQQKRHFLMFESQSLCIQPAFFVTLQKGKIAPAKQ